MWQQKFISNINTFRRFSQCNSTIFALSSGHGKCGVAVIRISGPNAASVIRQMTNLDEMPKPRMATLKYIHDPQTLEKLDKGLILWFPGPRSFTGEDSCEIQVHGGSAVVSALLLALSKIHNFRPAEPGEFTKRAFFNGKLDLTEIEGLGDLIHAETEMQRKQAFMQMEGTLSKMYNKWRSTLLQSLAHIEAFIDFSEEHIEESITENVNKELELVKTDIQRHLADGRRGERLRHGVKTAIIGEPNAGKSSLFNALCKKEAAIVTPIPGTTRDLIEMHINVNGYPLALTDTAGLRKDTTDLIEREGISRAQKVVKTSDLLLIVIDSTIIKNVIKTQNMDAELYEFLTTYLDLLNLGSVVDSETDILSKLYDVNNTQNCIFIFNKTDLLLPKQVNALKKATENKNICCVSCISEDGFPLLIEILTRHLKNLCGCPSEENPTVTNMRQRHHLSKCTEHLDKYFSVNERDVIIAAHHLRQSVVHLGKITGKVTSDEILDVIFKDFCIGK